MSLGGNLKSLDFSGLLERICGGYASDPWFCDQVNVRQLVRQDGIWWCKDAIAIPNDREVKLLILWELHNAPLQRTFWCHQDLESRQSVVLVA